MAIKCFPMPGTSPVLTGGQKNETSREEQTLSPGSLNGSIRLWEAGLEGSCTGGLGSSERLLQDPRAPAWLAMDLAGGGGRAQAASWVPVSLERQTSWPQTAGCRLTGQHWIRGQMWVDIPGTSWDALGKSG